MKVKEAILEEIGAYIDGRINELSELARKYAEIDNYAEIARMREMVKVQKMMEKLNNRP
jgi:DNA mismatch repair ATPase MutS|tara:strand:- start:452 stop:628 length:177 start_codon:yes stop_codon:yes gene_type:complete